MAVVFSTAVAGGEAGASGGGERYQIQRLVKRQEEPHPTEMFHPGRLLRWTSHALSAKKGGGGGDGGQNHTRDALI